MTEDGASVFLHVLYQLEAEARDLQESGQRIFASLNGIAAKVAPVELHEPILPPNGLARCAMPHSSPTPTTISST
jgi:hypothetical protein